jgi:predicted transcriptional regulator
MIDIPALQQRIRDGAGTVSEQSTAEAVCEVLEATPSASLAEIGRMIGAPKTTVFDTLARLERSGRVQREWCDTCGGAIWLVRDLP